MQQEYLQHTMLLAYVCTVSSESLTLLTASKDSEGTGGRSLVMLRARLLHSSSRYDLHPNTLSSFDVQLILRYFPGRLDTMLRPAGSVKQSRVRKYGTFTCSWRNGHGRPRAAVFVDLHSAMNAINCTVEAAALCTPLW
jgi:hypothetical protein